MTSNRQEMPPRDSGTAGSNEVPCAPYAEVGTLGILLRDQVARVVAIEEHGLRAADFHIPRNRAVFEAIHRQFAEDKPVDATTVAEQLHRHHQFDMVGGTAYLAQLEQAPASLGNVDEYVVNIKDASGKRLVYSRLHSLGQQCLNGTANISERLRSVADEAEAITGTAKTLRARFELIPAPQFKTRAKPDFLVQGVLVCNTLSCIVGPAATYKSFLAVGLMGAISTGTDWYGHPVRQGPVVYVSGEGSAGLGHRQLAWEIANEQPMPESCYFLPEAVRFHEERETEALLWAVSRLPHAPLLVIIDTLARCLVGGDENSAQDMGLFIAGADRVRATTGAHVLIVHHENRSGDIRGSTALRGALDTQISAARDRDGDGNGLTLTCKKQKDAAEFEAIHLVRRVVELDEQGSNSLVLDIDANAHPGTAHAVADGRRARHFAKLEQTLRALIDSGQALSSGDWQALAQTSGVAKSTFHEYRKTLLSEGRVVQAGTLYVAQVQSE